MLSTRLLFPIAAAVLAVNYVVGAYWRMRSPRVLFFVRLSGFVVLTALLIASGVAPYQQSHAGLTHLGRVLAGGLQVIWWASAAWLAVAFLRAFLSFGRQPREVKLAHDLIAGLVYAIAAVAVAAEVFALPIKGLLATSGVVAIVIGLALQNSLGDVFSGIVLNIERPYRVGDWIIVDETMQGRVIETNWRATHLLTGRQDIAIVPNSVIAKLKIVNCNAPTTKHGASLRIKLEPTLSPAVACDLLREVLLGVRAILSSPPPSVTVTDLSAETMELEVSYSVADIGEVDTAQNEIFDGLYRAASAVRLISFRAHRESMPERLISGLEIFASLMAEEKEALAGRMLRRVYEPGAVIAARETVCDALNIIAAGVLVAWTEHDGAPQERLRLTPGDYFGELGIMSRAPMKADITALTRAVVYQVPADALSPLLKNHPRLTDQLSETAARRVARAVPLEKEDHQLEGREPAGKRRLALAIHRIFSH